MALSFDGPNRVVVIGSGTTSIDVKEIWSRWVDWTLSGDNSKYLPAMRQLGGDDIDPGAGTSVPIYIFLVNGWRVRPQEASHTLSVFGGILLVQGGGDPFVNTTGAFNVRLNYSQPVQAITVATGGSAPSDPWATVLEGPYSAADLMRIMAAVLAGKVSGMEANAPVFRSVDDAEARVSAATTNDGNRTSVTLNGN